LFYLIFSGRGDHFRFGSVFIKKSNQTFFKKKTESELVQTDRFWFGYFRTKTYSNWFGLVFFGLTLFFSGLAWFFFVVWVRFGFFGFRLIKPKLNRTSRFFQNSNRFNRFFFTVWFFQLFFF